MGVITILRCDNCAKEDPAHVTVNWLSIQSVAVPAPPGFGEPKIFCSQICLLKTVAAALGVVLTR